MKIQQRSLNEIHTTNLQNFRKGNKNLYEIIKDYKTLSKYDFNEFKWTTVLVASNEEKNIINLIKVKNFAKSEGLPVIAWHKMPPGNITMDHNKLKEFIESNPELQHYLVPGAPAILLENINQNLKIVNGTKLKLHSLTLNPETKLEDLSIIRRTMVGEIAVVNEPISLNVAVTGSCVHKNWPKETAIGVDEDNDVVIPITLNLAVTYAEDKRLGNRPLKFKGLPYDLSFAITFHKSQGQTLEKVILDLRKRPKSLGTLPEPLFM